MARLKRPAPMWARSNHITEETRRKQSQVLKLRSQALSFEAIGKQMGVTRHYARHLYHRAMADIIAEDVTIVRKMENVRLDEMWNQTVYMINQFHPLINSGAVVRDVVLDKNGKPVLDSEGEVVLVKVEDLSIKMKGMEVLLKIIDMRAKLNGLYAPTKIAPTDPTGELQAAASPVMFYLPSNERDVTPASDA